MKRSTWMPWTWDQKVTENDVRTKVNSSGPKSLFIKVVKFAKRKLATHLYQSGNGTCAALVSTFYKKHQWDITLAKSSTSDFKWYFSNHTTDFERQKKAFRRIGPMIMSDDMKEDEERRLKSLFEKVNPLTCEQGHPIWFLLQSWSITSSSTHQLLDAMIKSKEFPQDLASSLQTVLEYANMWKPEFENFGKGDADNDEQDESRRENEENLSDAEAIISLFESMPANQQEQLCKQYKDDASEAKISMDMIKEVIQKQGEII